MCLPVGSRGSVQGRSAARVGVCAKAEVNALELGGSVGGDVWAVACLVGRPILQRFLPQSAERAILALTLGVALYILVSMSPCLVA